MPIKTGTILAHYDPRPMAPAAWAKSIGGRDTRLGRDVGIQVLPAAFARDEERMRRFEQEARGALHHPNRIAKSPSEG